MPREVAHLMAEVTALGGHCDAQLATSAVLACVPHGNAFTCSDDGTQLCTSEGKEKPRVVRIPVCLHALARTPHADVHDGDTPSFSRRRCYAVADVVDAESLSQTPDGLTSSGVAAEARAWLQHGFNATVLAVSPVRTSLLRAMPGCRSSGVLLHGADAALKTQTGVSNTLWGNAQSPLGPHLLTALFQLYGPMHLSCWLVCPGMASGGSSIADCFTVNTHPLKTSAAAPPPPPTRVLVTTIDEMLRCTALIGHHYGASSARGATCSAVFARAVPRAGGPALTLALVPGPSTPTAPHLPAATWRSAWLSLCKLLTSPRPAVVPSLLSFPLEACLATFLGVASNARTFIVADVADTDIGAACRLLAVTCPHPGSSSPGERTPVAGRVHADVPCVRATTLDLGLRQAGASLWCDGGAIVRWRALEAQVWAPSWQQQQHQQEVAAPVVPRGRAAVQLGHSAPRRAPSAWPAPSRMDLPAAAAEPPAPPAAAVEEPRYTSYPDEDTHDADGRLSFTDLFARLAPEGALDAPYEHATPSPAAWAATSARVARDAALDAVEMSQRAPTFDAVDAQVLTTAAGAAAAAPRRRPSRPWHVLSPDQAAVAEAQRRVEAAEETATQCRAEAARLTAELAVVAAQRDRWRHLATSFAPEIPAGPRDDGAAEPPVHVMGSKPTAAQAAALAASSRRAHAGALRRLAAAQTAGEAAARRATSAEAAVVALTAANELTEQRLQAERTAAGRLRAQVAVLEAQLTAARAQAVDAEAASAAVQRSAALFHQPESSMDAGLLVAQARQATLDAVLSDLQERLGRPL